MIQFRNEVICFCGPGTARGPAIRRRPLSVSIHLPASERDHPSIAATIFKPADRAVKRGSVMTLCCLARVIPVLEYLDNNAALKISLVR